ncbi:MAG TPA: replication initiator protein A [Azospirillaceae bacterium]|nr:replication initiator protein A [Azospirillaceae bacterium]
MGQQLDFHLDSPLKGSVKSARAIMEFPFFDLSRGGRKRLTYDDGETRIDVRAIEGSGIANIYDKDLILYVASLMVERMNAGEVPDREFVFTAHDFFRVASRDSSKRSYDNLEAMIDRLKGTMIKTNIETGGEGVDGYFSWLDSGTAIAYRRDAKTGEKRLRAIKVVLCTWLYRAILKDGHILTYHNSYFDLKPIERRLYDIARCHCGYQDRWTIGLEKLHKKIGVTAELKKVKALLVDLEANQRLPEYNVYLVGLPRSPLTKAAQEAGLKPKRGPSLKSVQVVFMPKGKALPEFRRDSAFEADEAA